MCRQRGHIYRKSILGTSAWTDESLAGHRRITLEILLRTAFDSGYEAAADYAPSGEHLAAAQTLQYAFYDGRRDKAGCCIGRTGNGPGIASHNGPARRLLDRDRRLR